MFRGQALLPTGRDKMMSRGGTPRSGTAGQADIVRVEHGLRFDESSGNRFVIGMQHLYCLSAALAERV
jgi:hypothetical protein